MLNCMVIDKVYTCKYLVHCINDILIDDHDMARQRVQICPGQCIGTEVVLCVTLQKLSECPCSSRIAPPCTQVR